MVFPVAAAAAAVVVAAAAKHNRLPEELLTASSQDNLRNNTAVEAEAVAAVVGDAAVLRLDAAQQALVDGAQEAGAMNSNQE
jgi:hypothetical protein